MSVPKALTIAGSDSGGGAGIQADLKTFAALGVYGCSVITAITAQNTREVTGIEAVSAEMVRKQLEAVLSDIRPDVVKIGMLANASIIDVVAATLQQFPQSRLVLDPVMIAKSGAVLLARDSIKTLSQRLIPLSNVITPNIPEAEVLTGMKLTEESSLLKAATAIRALGAKAVVIKGGHMPGVATRKAGGGRSTVGEQSLQVVDVLDDGNEVHRLSGPWIEIRHTHGTGCTLASAIAAGLAHGLDVYASLLQAREFLTKALRTAFAVGQGRGPVHHFHEWWHA
jgi:hydroxymethylpyrimidine/phosphomethylpyrimidine kinase